MAQCRECGEPVDPVTTYQSRADGSYVCRPCVVAAWREDADEDVEDEPEDQDAD